MGAEILTLGISTIVGIVARLLAARMEIKKQKMEYKLKQGDQAQKGFSMARLAKVSQRFAMTRQIIALSIIGAVVIWPKLIPSFFPKIPVYYCDYVDGKSFIFGLFSSSRALDCITATGILITPVDVQLALAVAGLYLGATVAVGK